MGPCGCGVEQAGIDGGVAVGVSSVEVQCVREGE